MDLFFQALLVSVVVWFAFVDASFLHTFFYRPVVLGPVVGLIMGNLSIGLQVGVAIELMFLAVVFVGMAIPPDEKISTGVATALACITGSVEVGIATALPIAIIGQMFRHFRSSVLFEFTQKQFEKSAAKASVFGMITWCIIIPNILVYLLFGVPTFVAIYIGAESVQQLISAIPTNIITGLAAGGGLFGAVGIALLLSTIKSKTTWPYFILGFFLAAYLKISMIGVTLVAFAIIALTYYKDDKERELQ